MRFAKWRGGELKVCASLWLDSKICRTGSRVRGIEGGSTGFPANGRCKSSGVVEGLYAMP